MLKARKSKPKGRVLRRQAASPPHQRRSPGCRRNSSMKKPCGNWEVMF